MPRFRRSLPFLALAALAFAPSLRAQAPAGETFPGVKQALTPQQYAEAGVDKLSPEERAKLDAYLKGYFTGATQRVVEQAETRAVDRAVKEKKAAAPSLIDSRIVGPVSGWGERTVFTLENGQRWKPVGEGKRSFPPVNNPQVLIARDVFGYKMAISGALILRVARVH